MTEPSERTRPLDLPRTVAGRYVLGELIGRGGRGVVYAAEDPVLHRQVAVKVLERTADSGVDFATQEKEARLIAGMNHYALTTLFDAGVDRSDPDDPRVYLVMERIPGVDLKQWLAAHGPLTPAQVAYLGFDLAEGLQYVHEYGFLHRDIKPSNVLLADRDAADRPRAKLTDFGIASLIGGSDDGTATSGTAAYLSPEQAEGLRPTPASDVYALGLVLLEALTGRRAFPGHAEESLVARLDHDPLIPAGIPPQLAEIIRRMTALLPEDRPDLAEAALAFQNAFVEDLVRAGRVSPDSLTTEEEQRLAALRRYNILDTPPDDAFDRITHLACRLLDVPVAFIALVDADREWFKSRRGIEIDELDRDVALCATTVATGAPLVIEDVQVEESFAANPVVRSDPELHAFASVPLRTGGGHAIGTLCVFDRKLRRFTDEEIEDLEHLAAMAMRELDLRLASRHAAFER